jgi:hypothetical protein
MCQDDQDYITSLEEDAINTDEQLSALRTAARELLDAVDGTCDRVSCLRVEGCHDKCDIRPIRQAADALRKEVEG